MSAIGLLYAAWQGRSRKLWLAAGLVIGLNAYLYTASHILPLILLGIAFYLLLDWRELRAAMSRCDIVVSVSPVGAALGSALGRTVVLVQGKAEHHW